ncbi:hypothetical protein Tco_0919819 [Tanacetum coccineum]
MIILRLNLSMYRKAAKLEKQMNAKLAWIHEKYNHRSETHIGGLSSQTHEIGDVYLTAEELHQLHLDEEALRETLEEQTMDEKAREEKIRQKQADDDALWNLGVMIIDIRLRVRIIPGPAGLVQRAKLLKENVFILDPDGALMSTQEYMQKVVEDVGEDADFNSGAWVKLQTNYVNAFVATGKWIVWEKSTLYFKKGKLIVQSCSPKLLEI